MKCVLFFALVASAYAQVQTPGEPAIGPLGKRDGIVERLAINSTAVSEYRKEMGQDGTKVGGFAFPVPVDVQYTEGSIWTYTFKATDEITKGMYVTFSDFFLPEGSSLFAYTETGVVAGAFTSANNKKNGGFMIRPLEGKELTIEFNAGTATEKPRLRIDTVGMAYTFPGRSAAEKGPSGWCNVNTACSEADEWRDEIRGIVVMMSSRGGYCSGSMINNPEGRQMVLTAYHCSPSSNDLVGFNFEEATCNGNDNTLRITDTAQGLTTLGRSSASDYHLVEVQETIPSSYGPIYLNGWNAEDVAQYTSPITCISHPSIDRKKFTQHYGPITRTGYLSRPGTTHWYVPSWELGTTEGGSSGSPLFNSNKQIIGQLHGGYASCTYNYDDYYGSLAVSYTDSDLQAALGSSGSMDGAYM